MGAALAQAVVENGDEALVISGPVEVTYPKEAEVIRVTTTEEMLNASTARFPQCVGAIGAAAPCDYEPFTVLNEKMSKEDFIRAPENNGEFLLRLRETPDVMAALGAIKRGRDSELGGQWLVAFALEISDRHVRAMQKLQKKHCDLILVNGPSAINGATSRVEILNASGEMLAHLSGDKLAVARGVISEISRRLY